MDHLVIELPPKAEQDAFNRLRWEELSRRTDLARLEDRIETDRNGNIVMSPFASPSHVRRQSRIARLLETHLEYGEAFTECPVSTSDGVRLIDVVWYSRARLAAIEDEPCFSKAAEICVEVVSPSNSPREIAEKRRLYFEAGAREFWTCSGNGRMRFFLGAEGDAAERSILCPDFPEVVELA
jgi:Uma2 family endonuclease